MAEEIVVALEIGTCYSGIVLTTRDEFLKNPTSAYAAAFQTHRGQLGAKCSTCLLFDAEQNFHSFGHKAEEEYGKLMAKDEHRDWLFFSNFSSKINHDQILEEDFTIMAFNQRQMSAKTLITTFIRELKKRGLRSFEGFPPECFRWIFVVPSSWNKCAKIFLKACGIQTGIPETNITFALGTEAVTLFAKYSLPKLKEKDPFPSENIHMVIDAGGSSIDTTLFEILPGGDIREPFVSSDEYMGSQKIKAAFYSTIEEITGKEELEIYNAEYHSDFLSIQEDLEQKIAEFTPNDHNEYLKLNITPSFCELVKERLQNMPNFKDRLHIRRDKCYLGLEEVKSYMNAPVSDICNYTQKALSHPKGKKVKTILLVGGFSQLKMLREKMSSKFPNMTIYVPPDARLAALRGALIYGFNRKILRERNASFTYVFTYVFTEKNGEECKMLDKKVPFQQIISIGSLIEEDTQIYEQTLWNVPGSKYVTFFFYASTEENPEDLKSENSFFIGSSSLALDPLGSRKIKISVSFTGTLMGVTLCCLPEKNESTIYLKSGYKLDTDEYEHVAAIDFGTTYSGFAYLSKHDFKSGQGIHKIETKIWIGGSLVSSKTSTCILFNPDGKFDSFGFEAEDKYSELVLEGSHADWYFFRRFKMKLYNEMKISANFQLTSENGKRMDASNVFTAALRYMRKEAINDLRKRNAEVPESYIQWILTVPAIWTDAAKSFMRQCAIMADINVSHLVLALEPEAAAMYVQISSTVDPNTGRKLLRKGAKYLVCDAGGGTIDTTVHEILDDYYRVRELHKAAGGNWGGTKVDEKWIEFLEELSGEEAMDEFRKTECYDVVDLYRDFETKKRTIKEDPDQKIVLKIPVSLSEICKKYNKGQSLSDKAANNKKYGNNIKASADKLIITAYIARRFFTESISQICEHLKMIFQHPNVKPVNIILLVGGYAECPLLQSAIENEFPSKTVIVPSFSGVAVLKGAVMFGHNPTLIHERIAKYTYGIAVCRLFEKGKHREDYMFERDGKIWCDNVFRSHVKSGEKIQVGKCQSSECYETFKGSGGVIVPVYASTVENPQYVTDDGCCLIGKIKFALNKDCTFGETINNLKVNFSFGGTEIEVKLECMKTGKTKSLYLDTQ